MAENDGWKRIGKYAIQSGAVTISKATVGGQHRYLLWDGNRPVDVFDSAAAAKAAAERVLA
jgi:hypothetical protein